MKRPLIAVICVLVLIAAGFVIAREIHSTSNTTTQTISALMPPGYGNLKLGMTEAQVTAVMGEPQARVLNPKYQFKTPEQWAAIQAQLNTDDPSLNNQSADNSSAAANLQGLKLGAEYEHRIKQTLHFQPKGGHYYAEVAFDGTGHVCNLAHGVIMEAMAGK